MCESIIAKARDHWNLVDANIELVAARENRVFRVDSADGVKALRLHRPGYRTVEQIYSELLWMEMLGNNGLHVSDPVRSIEGTLLLTVGEQTVSLLNWVEGVPFSEMTLKPEMYYQLGKTLATMHQLADTWRVPREFQRPTWDLLSDSPSWGRYWENPYLTQQQKALFIDFKQKAQLAIESCEFLDTGLIHADLVPDNVLYDDGQLQLIDFDDGGFGFRLFDLATITHRCKRLQGGAEFANAAIKGYCESYSIDARLLALFEALRACSYLGWNISRIDETNGRTRNARFVSEAEDAIATYFKH